MAITPMDFIILKTVSMFEDRFDKALLTVGEDISDYTENTQAVIEFNVPIASEEIILDVLEQVESLYEKAGWDHAVIMRLYNTYTLMLNKVDYEQI